MRFMPIYTRTTRHKRALPRVWSIPARSPYPTRLAPQPDTPKVIQGDQMMKLPQGSRTTWPRIPAGRGHPAITRVLHLWVQEDQHPPRPEEYALQSERAEWKHLRSLDLSFWSKSWERTLAWTFGRTWAFRPMPPTNRSWCHTVRKRGACIQTRTCLHRTKRRLRMRRSSNGPLPFVRS